MTILSRRLGAWLKLFGGEEDQGTDLDTLAGRSIRRADYSAKSGPQRVRDFLPDEAEVLLKSRFAEINVWRPIIELLKDTPLAVCDARSIAPNDLLPTDLVYQHRVGEIYSVTYNSSHRWFYFPDMQRNEALLIKCYDSEEDGRARFTAHTAFDDPTIVYGLRRLSGSVLAPFHYRGATHDVVEDENSLRPGDFL
jgi:hypothetical protein